MKEEAQQFLNNYKEFVDGVTAPPSKDVDKFVARIRAIEAEGGNPARLMTASTGMASEAGEFAEIVKKIMWHGKPYNADNIFHLERELGDIIWYWTQACIALNVDPVDIIAENVRKLELRYPLGKFDVFKSNNKADGDI